MIVALAASTAFMTTISSPVNTLVVGPGNYRFADFVGVGVPFSVLVMIVCVLLVPWLLPLYWASAQSRAFVPTPVHGTVPMSCPTSTRSAVSSPRRRVQLQPPITQGERTTETSLSAVTPGLGRISSTECKPCHTLKGTLKKRALRRHAS